MHDLRQLETETDHARHGHGGFRDERYVLPEGDRRGGHELSGRSIRRSVTRQTSVDRGVGNCSIRDAERTRHALQQLRGYTTDAFEIELCE